MARRRRLGVNYGLRSLADALDAIAAENRAQGTYLTNKKAVETETAARQQALDQYSQQEGYRKSIADAILNYPGMSEPGRVPSMGGLAIGPRPTTQGTLYSSLARSVPPGELTTLLKSLQSQEAAQAEPTAAERQFYFLRGLGYSEREALDRAGFNLPQASQGSVSDQEKFSQRMATQGRLTEKLLRERGGPLANPSQAFLQPEGAERLAGQKMGQFYPGVDNPPALPNQPRSPATPKPPPLDAEQKAEELLSLAAIAAGVVPPGQVPTGYTAAGHEALQQLMAGNREVLALSPQEVSRWFAGWIPVEEAQRRAAEQGTGTGAGLQTVP